MSEFEKWFNDNFGDEYLHYEEAVWNYQQQKIDKLKKDALELANHIINGDSMDRLKAREFLAKYKNESKEK